MPLRAPPLIRRPYSWTVTNARENPETYTRVERYLAVTSFAIAGLSLIALLVVIIFAKSLGNAVSTFVFVPIIGLPLSFAMVIALLILTSRRRSREARK